MNDRMIILLRYFRETARSLSFSGASRTLKVGQPTISKMIMDLEKLIGAQLFIRSKKGLKLTDHGRMLLKASDRIYSELESFGEFLGASREKKLSGEIRFAASDSILNYLVLPVLGALTKKHPDLRPRMTIAPARSALVEVMAGRLDFALFLSGTKQSGIVAKTLATVRSTLVVSPRARSSKEILHRFVGSLDIDDERTHSFPALEWLRSHYGDVEQVLSCNNLETIKRIVVRGGGIAILPLYMIQKELDGDRLQIFDQKYFYDGQLKLIMRAGENLSVRAKVLIDAIEHYATGVTHR